MYNVPIFVYAGQPAAPASRHAPRAFCLPHDPAVPRQPCAPAPWAFHPAPTTCHMSACRPRPASRPHPVAFGAPDPMPFIEQHLFNAGSRRPAPAEPQQCTDPLASLGQSLMNLGLIPEAAVAESLCNGASNPPLTPSHGVTHTDFRQALTQDILASLVNRIRQEGSETNDKGNENKQDEVEKLSEGSKTSLATKEVPLKWRHIIDCGKFGTERVLVKVDDGKVIVRASRKESSPHGFVSSTKMEQTIQLPCNIEREKIICRILSNSKLLIEAPIIARKSIDNNLIKPSPSSADDVKEEERNQTNKLKDASDKETEMKSETSNSEPIIDECCSDTNSECTKSEASQCDSFVVIEDGEEIETEDAIEDNNAEIIEKEEDHVEEKTGYQGKAHHDASEGDKTQQALTYKERERITTTSEAGSVTAENKEDTEEEFEQITEEETTNEFEAVQGNSNTIQNVDVLSKINDAMLEETNKQESQDDETHITNDDSDFEVRLELPSVDPSSIKVTMDDFRRLLVVQAALPAGQGHVSRVVPVPGHVEAAALRCQMQDGALTLTAPRATVRDIPVVM